MNTTMNGKKILAIFAHPDDESFGPGGTLALWAAQGAQIHLFIATKGEHEYDAEIRMQEVANAAHILGIQTIDYMGFNDGEICNNKLLELEQVITKKIEVFQPDYVITFGLNGLTGHIDHIAVASATTQACRKTKIAQKLYYYMVLKEQSAKMHDYFIYFPDGIEKEDADEIIDVSSVWDKRISAAKAHKSQQHDVDKFLGCFVTEPREYFLVRKKE